MPKRIIDFELDFANRDIIPKFSIKQFDDAIFNILKHFVVKGVNLCYNKRVGSLAKLVRQVTATH